MSEHNHDCGCGHDDCNCGEENLTVTLTLDNDEVLECAVLTIFSAGDRQYIALLPLEDAEDTEEGDVFIYRFDEDENGEPTSKMTMSTSWLPMLSTNGWTNKTLKN